MYITTDYEVLFLEMLTAIKIYTSGRLFLCLPRYISDSKRGSCKGGKIAGIETKSVHRDFEEVDRDAKLQRGIKEGWKTKQQPLSGSRIRGYG